MKKHYCHSKLPWLSYVKGDIYSDIKIPFAVLNFNAVFLPLNSIWCVFIDW